MIKIALGIEYCGSRYQGWQKQPSDLNIQGRIEQALSVVADAHIEVVCAGRTDAGVHALGQVAHFETTVIRSDRSWVLGANSHLPADIRIHWAQQMSDDFHARFSAIARQYTYILSNSFIRPGVFNQQIAWYFKSLQLKPMQEALQYLRGEHDFSAFRGAFCQAKTTVREIQSFSIEQRNQFFIFTVQANAFLHHMVRNLVGSLIKVGEGSCSPGWIKDVLSSKKRVNAGVTAPAEGLYFMQACYPDRFILPKPQPLFFFNENQL